MNIKREWATPIAAGAFLLSAATGVLIFFHVDSGLNKFVHEWLSWVLLGGVVLHIIANFPAFKRHLGLRRGQFLMGGFALVLALSFFSLGPQQEPGFMPPIRALSKAPLTTLAMVAGVSDDTLRQRMVLAGLKPTSDQQTLNDLVGPDMRQQVRVLGALLAAPK